MLRKHKVLLIFGTRPEAIKMSPLAIKLNADERFMSDICVTGQHRQMLDQVLNIFKITPKYDMNLMQSNQSLNEITSNIITMLKKIIEKSNPDVVLVHGDTATTFAASLSSFYQKIPIGHVEAGLRTHNLHSPWPEEANRKLTAILSKYHFAPTQQAKNNLIQENYNADNIFVTGNTVIDSLMLIKDLIENDKELIDELKNRFSFIEKHKKLLLITGHRRENFGEGFENICKSILRLSHLRSDVQIIYPVHLNPQVKVIVNKILKAAPNVHLLEPQSYIPFVYLMMKSEIILTDSGGVQEEAPSLGKPVLVMRETTERPEAIKAGTVKLVGTDENKIVQSIIELLDDSHAYKTMSYAHNPYGDGKASDKIIDILINKLRKNNGN